MISWIQNTLERKGRIVFIILLAVVIVSFVFVIGETPGCVSSEPGSASQTYYGYSLNAEADPRSRAMVQEVIISSIVNRGQQPRDEQMLTQEFLSRIALLELADRLKIPEPNQDAFVQYLASIPFFQNEEGAFDPNRVTSFLDMTQLSRQFSEATINQTLSNDYRIQQLMSSIAAPGYTLPYEVAEQERRSAASFDLAIAELNQDDVELSVETTEEDLQNFFIQQVEAYRIPETRILTVAFFTADNLSSNIPEPSEEDLKNYFAENRSQYVNAEAEDPAAALPSLEEIREEVVTDWKAEQAMNLARHNSEEFVYSLFDQDVPINSPEFTELVARFSADLQEIPPMVGSRPPSGSSLPQAAFTQAARLDSLRFYTDPIETDDGTAVILLEEIVPSRIPEFETVRDEVFAAYQTQAEREAFVAKGEEIRAELNQMITEGKPFAEAAQSLDLKVSSFSNVGWDNIPEDLNNSFIRLAETLPNKEVSAMIVSRDKGTFVFVDSRGAPAADPASDEYQRARAVLSSNMSRLFISSFVNDLIQAGATQSTN